MLLWESQYTCLCGFLSSLLQSYSIEFIDLLYTVHQGSECYCVVQSLSVQVVLPHQHHWGGGGKRMQGQARKFIGIVLDLVLATGIELPGDTIKGAASHAQHTSRQGDVVRIIYWKRQRGEEAGGARQHGCLVQAVPNGDPAGRLIADASGLYHYVFVLRFQGLLQLILKLVLSVLSIVDLMHNVTVRGGQGDPVNGKKRIKTTQLEDRRCTHPAARTEQKNP